MRSEKQVYDTILNFARMNERIRVVTLEGSRTNINIPPERFQITSQNLCGVGLVLRQIQFAVECFEQGTFSRSHFPDQIDKFSFLGVEVHVVEDQLVLLVNIYFLIIDKHNQFILFSKRDNDIGQ